MPLPQTVRLCAILLAIAICTAAAPLLGADRCRLVRDIDVATTTTAAWNQMASVGSICYFTADDGVHETEIWRSDGTTSGTYLLADVNPGPLTSVPMQLVTMGGALYFVAYDGALDRELWRSDGGLTSTYRVANINAGGSSSPTQLSVVGDRLYFFADDGVHGAEPWVSDGTAAGTHLVADITPGVDGSSPGASYATGFVGMGGAVFFPAYTPTDGLELWRTDGTVTGTWQCGDIYAGSGNASPRSLTAVGNQLFFSANNPTNGYELWATNGTSATTRLVLDIYPGAGHGNPTYLVAYKNFLYFAAVDPTHGNELWRSDGSAVGTIPILDIYPGTDSSSPYELTVVGSTLYFVCYSNRFVGWELWKSDGWTDNTFLVKDINPNSTEFDGSSPGAFTASGGLLYFYAQDDQHGFELWRSDGTTTGTYQVRDIRPGPIGSQTRTDQHKDIVDAGGTLFFFANDGTHGPQQLWATRFQTTGDWDSSLRIH